MSTQVLDDLIPEAKISYLCYVERFFSTLLLSTYICLKHKFDVEELLYFKNGTGGSWTGKTRNLKFDWTLCY